MLTGPDQVLVSAQPYMGSGTTPAAGVRNLLQSAPPTTWVIQVLPTAGNAAVVQTDLAAIARRPPDELLQMLRSRGATFSGLQH